MLEFGGIREVSISGSDDRLCRFRISLLRAQNACRFARARITRREGASISLAGCFRTRSSRDTRRRTGRCDLYRAPSRFHAISCEVSRSILRRSKYAHRKSVLQEKLAKSTAVTRVFTVQILQRRAILFFPTLRRDRQMARQTQDTRDGEVRAIPFAAAFRVRSKKRGKRRERKRDGRSRRKRRGEEERRDRHLGNDFPWILLPKRPYLGGGPGSFLLFPYFIFQSRNSRPCASLLLPALSLSLSPPLHTTMRRRAWREIGERRREEEASNPYMQI